MKSQVWIYAAAGYNVALAVFHLGFRRGVFDGSGAARGGLVGSVGGSFAFVAAV